MLAKLIDTIGNLAVTADGVQITTHKGMPGKVVLSQNGAHEVLDTPPPRRGHMLCGYADVIKAAGDPDMTHDPEVYHSSDGITVLLQGEDRRDLVHVPLQHSQRWETLRKLERGGRFNVRDAVKLLRFDLHGTGVENVVRALSKIDFSRKSDGRTDIAHGKESLGRSVEAAVQQADDIPETFDVSLSVYTNPGMTVFSETRVRCGIYLDVKEEVIEFKILADQMDAAENAAQTSLGIELEGDLPNAKVFHGSAMVEIGEESNDYQ